mmetsp:Transcript_45132/g.98099  ORF Transcript_45132/g.98099 Transcript_45132/m.98099 type:complete len:254 (+) Transcript_45132:744-1505(+)
MGTASGSGREVNGLSSWASTASTATAALSWATSPWSSSTAAVAQATACVCPFRAHCKVRRECFAAGVVGSSIGFSAIWMGPVLPPIAEDSLLLFGPVEGVARQAATGTLSRVLAEPVDSLPALSSEGELQTASSPLTSSRGWRAYRNARCRWPMPAPPLLSFALPGLGVSNSSSESEVHWLASACESSWSTPRAYLWTLKAGREVSSHSISSLAFHQDPLSMLSMTSSEASAFPCMAAQPGPRWVWRYGMRIP